ncbi:unnamed protein product [Polarella glacialis]|uniref:tRNA/rRNA methyltransferase SpoU type domain-containing protein n=1 Tax=Polarella glacialis TaxID=89957 RepID=A0A813KIM2_POLGL|nr:unnamed protein product [Polarella glacialis]
MAAAKLTLGAVRLIWASSAGLGAEPTNGAFSKFVWPALEPTLQDMHRRSYLSRSAAVATLFGCAYAAALLPDGQAQVDLHPNERLEMLSYVEAKAAAALGCGRPQEVLQEAAWVWLYALVLEQFWRPGLPHGEELAASTAKVLVHGAACTAGGEVDTSSAAAAALAPVAAAALLGVLAPKMGAVARRCELFLVLWRAQAPGKPSGVNDSRFSIGSQEELGDWPRSRLEEYEDLHRQEREGFGRVLEWRDASATFLLAKWRALALIARQGGSSLLQELPEACRSGAPGSTLSELAADLLAELDSLQPPQVAFWCVVARHIAFPVFFVESQDGAGASQEEQRQGLHSVCRALQGSIVQGVGEGSVFLPRGCMLELGSALCDPVLRAAELRLFASQETAGPLTSAVHELLSLGEVALNISRSVAVPLLATLLAEGATRDPVGAASSAEIFTSLLLHSDMTVRDGALCHSIGPCVGVVDVAGPGGKPALAAAVGPKAPELCQKFAGTGGLPRVLALTALDGLAQQQSRQGVPPVISATLLQLLAALRRTLEAILKGSGKPGQVSKPLTPMPLSPQHRLQLRGWQAVLVLGCHADRPTAEMLLPELFWHLNTPHLPDVRDYQELLGCALCGRFPDLVVEQLLVPALKRYEAQPQVGASLLVISSYLFKEWAAAALSPEKQALPAYAAALCRVSVPYLGHNSAYVRGIAAWGFFELVDAAKVTGVFEALEGFGELISELHCFLTKNVECQKMRRRLKLVFLGLELGSKTALESLTELSEVLPQVDEVKTGEAAEIPMPLHIFADGDFKPSSTFLTLLKDEVVLGVEDLYKHEDNTQYSSRDSEAPEVLPSGQGAAGGAAGLQRKFVPPAPPVLPEECGGTSRGASVSALARKRAPLIVIASLVDKTPNLAGLCRTSEVFNCEALWLPNLKVATDQSFKTISVTAEKWLPLRGVSRAALTAELLEFRRKGYALVGVEQTHTSVPLDKWVFAEKTVMLLGAEKEGIHAELLPLMDGCVEIPQQGQLRSLNVHVSGSVVIWEYVRQARLRASAGEPSQEAIEVVQGAYLR